MRTAHLTETQAAKPVLPQIVRVTRAIVDEPTWTRNAFGGYDSHDGRVRICSDDLTIRVYSFTLSGVVRWSASFDGGVPDYAIESTLASALVAPIV